MSPKPIIFIMTEHRGFYEFYDKILLTDFQHSENGLSILCN